MLGKFLASLSIIILIILPAFAHEKGAHEEGKKHVIDLKKEAAIGNMSNVTSLHGTIYMTGQPDQATVGSLKEQGFQVVLNIRGADEGKFDEKAMVTGDGLAYYNVPLLKDGQIQDSAVSEIHAIIKENKGKKILFHCASANRVAGWFGAHLARDMGYETEAAISLAKEAGLTKAGMEKILRDYLANLSR